MIITIIDALGGIIMFFILALVIIIGIIFDVYNALKEFMQAHPFFALCFIIFVVFVDLFAWIRLSYEDGLSNVSLMWRRELDDY